MLVWVCTGRATVRVGNLERQLFQTCMRSGIPFYMFCVPHTSLKTVLSELITRSWTDMLTRSILKIQIFWSLTGVQKEQNSFWDIGGNSTAYKILQYQISLHGGKRIIGLLSSFKIHVAMSDDNDLKYVCFMQFKKKSWAPSNTFRLSTCTICSLHYHLVLLLV